MTPSIDKKTSKTKAFLKTLHSQSGGALLSYHYHIQELRHWFCENRKDLYTNNRALFIAYDQALFCYSINEPQSLLKYPGKFTLNHRKRILTKEIISFKNNLKRNSIYICDTNWFLPYSAPSSLEEPKDLPDQPTELTVSIREFLQ